MIRLQLPRSRFARSAALVGAGTMLAQLVTLAASPLVTRIYNPEAFGNFFVIQSVSLPLAAGIAMRLEYAVPLPRNDLVASTLARLAVTTAVIASVLTLGALVLFNSLMAEPLGFSAAPLHLVWIAPLAGSVAIFNVLNAIALRGQKFRILAVRQLLVAAATVSGQVLGGLATSHFGFLVGSAVLGYICGALLVAASIKPASENANVKTSWWSVLKRYRRFPLILAPAGMINALGSNAALLMIAGLYVVEDAGQFGLAMKMVAVPIALIGTTVAQVYLSELSALTRSGSSRGLEMFTLVSKRLLLLGGVGVVLLWLFGPWIFVKAFGDEWYVAGQVAQAYALGAGAQAAVSPTSQTLIVYERLGLQFAWDVMRLAASVGAVWTAWSLGVGVTGVAWCLSVAMTCMYAANWVISRAILKEHASL